MTPLGLSWTPANRRDREAWATGQEVLVSFILDDLPAIIVQRGSFDCLVQYRDGRCERKPYGDLRLALSEEEQRARVREMLVEGHPQAERAARMLGMPRVGGTGGPTS